MRQRNGKMLTGAVAWSLRISDVAFIRGQAVDALERHEPSLKSSGWGLLMLAACVLL